MYGSSPPGSVPGALTAGLAEVFGDMGLGSRNDPSRPLSAFGQAPLRHSGPPSGSSAQVDPAFRHAGQHPSQPMPPGYPEHPSQPMPPGYPQHPSQPMQPPFVPQQHRPVSQPMAAGYPQQQAGWSSPMATGQDPAFRGSVPMTPLQPGPGNPPTTSMGGVSATALISALEHQQNGQAPETTSLETLRMQMFGSYYKELEGRMGELRTVTDGTVARSRRALMERMDELGAGLHRDMVAMRQEMQKELEDLKRDVFSAVMSISALNDKLGMTDSRFRETWMAVTKALTDRIDSQATGLATSVKGMEAKMDQLVDERVDNLVEKAMLRQVALWRAKQAATSGPLETPANAV